MNKKMNQKGAVSLITVVIFATIITVLITAYLRSAVSQNNEAINYDFSTRAYYSAESGVQDAVRLASGDKPNCAPYDSSLAALGRSDDGGEFGLSYTCQLVDFTPTDLTGVVQPNGNSITLEVDPESEPDPSDTELVIRWSERFEDTEIASGSKPALFPRNAQGPVFPPLEQWNQSGANARPVHALLRVAVISHPDGQFSRDSITQRVVFMNPANDTNGSSAPAQVSLATDIGQQQEELMHNAICYPNNKNAAIPSEFKNYSCRATIKLNGYNFTANKVYAHVGAVYRSADFSVELTSGGGAIPLVNSQYTVDVTGRAGTGVFRRIKQTINLGGYASHEGPDAALIAGEGICKQFVLRADPASFEEGCNPLAN